MKIVIWFTWEMWCGKDTATAYIQEKLGWVKFKFSQSQRDILDRIWVEQTRENISAVSTFIREAFWQDLLSKIMKKDVLESSEDVILIDWVRRQSDIVYLTQIPEFLYILIQV